MEDCGGEALYDAYMQRRRAEITKEEYQKSCINMLDTEFPSIAQAIRAERVAQIRKWGDGQHNGDKFCRILGEEFGEVCEAVEDLSVVPDGDNEKFNAALDHLRMELVQVAAVAVRFIQCVDRARK